MKTTFRIFESYEENWETLFRRAADFASELAPGQLINISHSESVRSKGVVVVWFWERESSDVKPIGD